jgi:signal transduction histidine kinase
MNGRILIVDDDPGAVITIEATLSGEGHQLEFADSGPAAITKAEALLPDLILLDMILPGIDGFEVCRRIRATPRLAEVPIIILTALDDRQSRLLGIEAGADDFITKPVDRQELRLRTRSILRLNRYRTLLEQRDNLHEMAGRLVNAQEQERKRISRELHDDLGQALIAHVLSLRNLQGELPIRPDELQKRIDIFIAETNQTLNKMRQLAQDLRPALLDTLGLRSALENHCREFSLRANLPVSFEADAELPAISDVYSIILYRFLQETLTNVIKHARATQIWVELYVDDHHLVLNVQDNGNGFNGGNEELQNGIGITGLRERLTMVGGQLTVTSSPNGTVVSAHLPLNENRVSGGAS